MERKKVVFLSLFLLLLFLASCAVQPDVALITTEAGPAITTTSTIIPLPPLVIVQAAPATTTTTIIPKPAITEPAFRNLFGIVNLCAQEIKSYGIDTILPVKTATTLEGFQDAKAYYEVEIRQIPFNGISAYHVAIMLSGAEADLQALLEEGLPLRSEAEMEKASAAAEYARSRDSASEAADRFENAEAEWIYAQDFHANKEYRASIASYKRASLLYESAAMKADVEALYTQVAKSGFGHYSPFHAAEAERLRAEDRDLYDSGSNDSIRAGTEKLKIAARDCSHILAWGAEQYASETRTQATTAKQAADAASAEFNAQKEYLLASFLMADGDQKREYGDFADAATDYKASASAFTEAHRIAAWAKFSEGLALERAKAAADERKSSVAEAALRILGEARLAAKKAEADRASAIAREANRQAAELAANLASKEAEISRLNAEKAEAERQLTDTQDRLREANRLAAERLSVEKAIAKKAILINLDQKAFSPNGDGMRDIMNIRTHVPAIPVIRQYEVVIYGLDASGNRDSAPIKSWKGSMSTSDSYAWDGSTDYGARAPDGDYQVALNVRFSDDEVFSSLSPAIMLDTKAPRISVEASPILFSPNGDGNKDTVVIAQNSSIGDDWTGLIRNASSAIVRSWSWKSEAKNFTWDGRDSAGSIVEDGVYSYEVKAADIAGNTSSANIPAITVDGTIPKVKVTASNTGISPNGDGIHDKLSFSIGIERREGIESWRFSLVDEEGTEKRFFDGTGSELPEQIVWDGRDLQGQVVRGKFIGKLSVFYAKGDFAQASSASVLVDASPPAMTVGVDVQRFSPDGDGVDDTLNFHIGADAEAGIVDWNLKVFETATVESSSPRTAATERRFTEWSGKGNPPATIAWDGKSASGALVESATDYPFKFVAHDALGNSTTISGVIAVDVLVIRDGSRFMIKVPSIVFRANFADFLNLSPEIVARNEEVVARIAQILNKYPDYRIRIEGHANSAAKIMGLSQAKINIEESRELIPLSAGRAELVRDMLVRNGVDAKLLSVVGLGSSRPVVEFQDAENRWKNRRVEFVLIKK